MMICSLQHEDALLGGTQSISPIEARENYNRKVGQITVEEAGPSSIQNFRIHSFVLHNRQLIRSLSKRQNQC